MQVKKRIINKYNESLKQLTLEEKGRLADYCGVSIETMYRALRLRTPLLTKPAYLNNIKTLLGLPIETEIVETYRVRESKKQTA